MAKRQIHIKESELRDKVYGLVMEAFEELRKDFSRGGSTSYLGIPGATVVYPNGKDSSYGIYPNRLNRGYGSDPIITYKGKQFRSADVDDSIESAYDYACQEEGYNGTYEEWVAQNKPYIASLLDDMVYQSEIQEAVKRSVRKVLKEMFN